RRLGVRQLRGVRPAGLGRAWPRPGEAWWGMGLVGPGRRESPHAALLRVPVRGGRLQAGDGRARPGHLRLASPSWGRLPTGAISGPAVVLFLTRCRRLLVRRGLGLALPQPPAVAGGPSATAGRSRL